MTDTNENQPAAVMRGEGSTPTERYVQALCEKNFLSLWSYPRPHRDQGGCKEICDLLVVMGDDVVIFSDKHCELTPKKTLEVDWHRWFRSAVWAAAQQAWGAERWLHEHPDRVFADDECGQLLPIPIPPPDRARYHLIVTVHGVAAACHAMLGGSGSLMIKSDIHGLEGHRQPFTVGDLDPDKTFVHVFDDASLDVVMKTLDTTPDFLRYLREKERFLRSRPVFSAGEEQLLAFYSTKLDDSGEHAFVIDSDPDFLGIDESWWPHFEASPERAAKIEQDRVSYLWDRLIEKFSRHALAGTQYFATEPGVASTEMVMRFMASESRLRRRHLAQVLREALERTAPNQGRRRMVLPGGAGEALYVFVLVPWDHKRSEEENREFRRRYLEAVVRVAKLKNPDAVDIVGIATESGLDNAGRSEDALYFDARSWTPEEEEEAKQLSKDLGIFVSPTMIGTYVDEYRIPEPSRARYNPLSKNPRNKLCPCGSGKKYKRCHGR